MVDGTGNRYRRGPGGTCTPSVQRLLLAGFALLVACGDPISPVGRVDDRTVLDTPAGTSCTGVDVPDVFSTVRFDTSHPIRASAYGCLIVDAADGLPVLDGTQSARFEVRPGDCTASAAFDDCTNDRSRHEIQESHVGSTEGQTLVYDTHVYIPPQPRFRPVGDNLLFLTQINYGDPDSYGTVAYLEVGQGGELIIRTHQGLGWDVREQYVVATNPVGRWVNVRYEIKSTAGPDGFLKVYVDGDLRVDEVRQTLSTPVGANTIKVGIYNAFKSDAKEEYDTQVVFFDGIAKGTTSTVF